MLMLSVRHFRPYSALVEGLSGPYRRANSCENARGPAGDNLNRLRSDFKKYGAFTEASATRAPGYST